MTKKNSIEFTPAELVRLKAIQHDLGHQSLDETVEHLVKAALRARAGNLPGRTVEPVSGKGGKQ